MELHYRALGEGPPLLLLHGLLGSLDNWLPLGRRFAERFRVLAVDQRNHGLSPHSAEFGYPLMARDLHELMSRLGIPRAHLLGHSMGGKTAMQFALMYPDQVDKLVVVDVSPRAYVPRQSGTLQALLALDLTRFRRRDEMDSALAGAVPDPELRRFLLKNVGRDSTGAFRWKANLTAIWENRRCLAAALEAEGQFAKPTLFLRGGQSDYLTEAEFDSIRRWFPRAELRTIPGAGHWVHAESPEEFFGIVLEFLLPTGQAPDGAAEI